jgi:hypothetical protein
MIECNFQHRVGLVYHDRENYGHDSCALRKNHHHSGSWSHKAAKALDYGQLRTSELTRMQSCTDSTNKARLTNE